MPSSGTSRHGKPGSRKPEALKHDFAGYWSRRITDEHRLVYKVVGDEVRIAACAITRLSGGGRLVCYGRRGSELSNGPVGRSWWDSRDAACHLRD